MKCKSIFITATGTDVGKTYISALLLKKMKEYGLKSGYYKPALSGAIKLLDGSLLPGDCDFVIKMANLDIDPNHCVSYCFEEAVSPHLAAKRLGINIDKEVIKSDFNRLTSLYDYMVVEGAGGITCPFNLDNEDILLPDVIKMLNTDILIVADAGLGTINSVLTTYNYAKSVDLNIIGFVFNNYDKNNFMHIDNKKQVEYLTGKKVLATVSKNDSDIKISKKELILLFNANEKEVSYD